MTMTTPIISRSRSCRNTNRGRSCCFKTRPMALALLAILVPNLVLAGRSKFFFLNIDGDKESMIFKITAGRKDPGTLFGTDSYIILGLKGEWNEDETVYRLGSYKATLNKKSTGVTELDWTRESNKPCDLNYLISAGGPNYAKYFENSHWCLAEGDNETKARLWLKEYHEEKPGVLSNGQKKRLQIRSAEATGVTFSDTVKFVHYKGWTGRGTDHDGDECVIPSAQDLPIRKQLKKKHSNTTIERLKKRRLQETTLPELEAPSSTLANVSLIALAVILCYLLYRIVKKFTRKPRVSESEESSLV